MKTTFATLGFLATATLSATLTTTQARPMHAGINYQRYLEEKESVESELSEWLSKYEQDAKANGWIPPAESRSADEVVEDQKQRFFLSKQLIKKLEQEQPDAKFSTDTPFTLFTEQEFATYVKNSYIGGKNPDADLPVTGGGADKAEGKAKNTTTSDKDDDDDDDDSVAGEAKIPTATKGCKVKPDSKQDNKTKRALAEARDGLHGNSNTTSSRMLQQQGSVDWSTSPCNLPIQNQGSCGSCWAFAAVGAVETAQCLKQGGGRATKYSEQQLTSCDGSSYGCNGGFPTSAFRYIQQTGLCRGDQYPYASASGRAPQCNRACQKTSVGIKQVQRVAASESALLGVLRNQPVVVAVAAGNNVWKQYRGGVVSACPAAQVDHAVIAVGFDGSSIKIKNSWGTRWGENGYIRLQRGGGSRGTCSVLADMSYPQM